MWKCQELNKQIVLKSNTSMHSPQKGEKKIKIKVNCSLAIVEKEWERVTLFSLTRLRSLSYADGHNDTQEGSGL